MYYSTTDLCRKLGVSRAWVNTYLRHLGVQGLNGGDADNHRTIYYDEELIVYYLNSHAIFSRQTELVDATQYASRDYLDGQMQQYDNCDALTREDARNKILGRILNAIVIADPRAAARERGLFPWRQIDMRIDSLDELATMAQMSVGRSQEIVYRNIFLNAGIRVAVHGRTWYMISDQSADDINDEWCRLITAR